MPTDPSQPIADHARSTLRLLPADLRAARALLDALTNAAYFTDFERDSLLNALQSAQSAYTNGEFDDAEDAFAVLDAFLLKREPLLAAELAEARTADERLLTDLRLWLLEELNTLSANLAALQKALIEQAERHISALMPGYIHHTPMAILSCSHWLLSFFWMLARDQDRLASTIAHTAIMPLGSDTLAGTRLTFDRRALAADLDLGEPSPNSLDAVTDTDFAAEFLFAAALIGAHLSRLADDLHLYTALGFFSTDDSFAPRMRAFRLHAELFAALGTLGSVERSALSHMLITAADTLRALISSAQEAVELLTVDVDPMLDALDDRLFLPDLTAYLIERGTAPSEAHQIVARLVVSAARTNKSIVELSLEAFQAESSAFAEDVFTLFEPTHAAAQRTNSGGTAPSAIRAQIQQAMAWLVGAGLA